MRKHTNFYHEVENNQPKDRSNAIIVVALGSLFIFCGVVLYVVSLVERVMVIN